MKEDNLHVIEVYINNELRKYNVSSLVSIPGKDINDISLEELDNIIEKISAYRVSILVLKEAVESQLNELKEKFEIWIGENWERAVSIAVDRRKKQKDEKGVPNSWFGSITKEEVKGILMTDKSMGTFYHAYSEKIRKYQKSLNLLDGLLNILEDRGSQLQSILKSRNQRKFR